MKNFWEWLDDHAIIAGILLITISVGIIGGIFMISVIWGCNL